ncbi:kinesin-like nuclear fusion protein, variant 2 [Basidiobolus ranarum]|uniref:Kinesin-like protein n=1 Tax=Basidiobolus ranarum TaxID=34480 RepID=A0ABR2VXK1_9FUNG
MVGPTNYKNSFDVTIPNGSSDSTSDLPAGAHLRATTSGNSVEHLCEHAALPREYTNELSELQSLLVNRAVESKSASRVNCDQLKFSDFEELRKQVERRTGNQLSPNGSIATIPDSSLQVEISRIKMKSEEQSKKYSKEIEQLRSQHESHLNALHQEYETLEQGKYAIAAELDDAQVKIKDYGHEVVHLESTVTAQSQSLSQLQIQQSIDKQQIEEATKTLETKLKDLALLSSQLCEAKSHISQMEAKLRFEETTRRKLHNTIQELKGNIRVFCRMRPLLGPEQMDDPLQLSFTNEDEMELIQNQESANRSKTIIKSYPFSFDKIFKPDATQSEVFEEISQLVQSALDGYPVCIFAYGQTGSGKTFTMEGPEQPDSETVGIIPRAVLQIYSTVKSLKQKGWEYVMEGQFLEIYNDTIHDLLGNGDFNKKHDIKHFPNGKTVVTDLTTVIIDSPEKMTAVMKRAGQNRAVASTHCNDRSSRSHSVFMLKLSGRNEISGETSQGVLNLIDLAGSERLSLSGSTGDRLRETQAINKSLSCLGDVIYSLANREAHVPYRNSKLTFLLQNSLGKYRK